MWWFTTQLLDTNLGSMNISMINDSSFRLGYPCDNRTQCTPYFIRLLPGTYVIECCGAEGDRTNKPGPGVEFAYGLPGKGACVTGQISFDEQKVLYAYVGGMGIRARGLGNQLGSDIFNEGGYNGGGSIHGGASAGSGGTDIRLKGGPWNDTMSLRSRIMVAGGGAGANDPIYTVAGDGGGLIGGDGNKDGVTGGRQTAGGTSHFPGSFGQGGGTLSVLRDGSGGGGGWYGGGKGIDSDGCGGGGSSYISGYEGCKAVDKDGFHVDESVHFSGFAFENGEMHGGVNNGTGTVTITKITASPFTMSRTSLMVKLFVALENIIML